MILGTRTSQTQSQSLHFRRIFSSSVGSIPKYPVTLPGTWESAQRLSSSLHGWSPANCWICSSLYSLFPLLLLPSWECSSKSYPDGSVSWGCSNHVPCWRLVAESHWNISPPSSGGRKSEVKLLAGSGSAEGSWEGPAPGVSPNFQLFLGSSWWRNSSLPLASSCCARLPLHAMFFLWGHLSRWIKGPPYIRMMST